MNDTPVTDATIADFRSEHAEALESRAHPLHSQRVAEITGLFERRHSAPAEVTAPAGNALEYRQQHNDALLDKSHPEHDVRTQELTKIHERDSVGGDQPGEDLMASAESPDAYDFNRFKARVPVDESLVPDPEFEQQARTWMHDAGLSRVEGEALASVYGESLRWSQGDVERIAATTQAGLEAQFGIDAVPTVAKAALRVAEESGAYDFLNDSGLLNHWSVVNQLVSKAIAKGYYKAQGN